MDIIWTVDPDKFVCDVEDDDKRELLIQVTQDKSSMISGQSRFARLGVTTSSDLNKKGNYHYLSNWW